ncbi:MAG TPA: 5-formyltetrahydrofolate cyclo-ligase [Geobacteraceae bacterium]|nr:5-formyltetrahydrofolate cyclo-ligase [Geobacteraceae bacterium]
MPKRSLRQSMLARRKGLTLAEARSASLQVQNTFISTGEFARARVVAIYAPIHNEVDTSEVMYATLASSKVLLLPAVDHDGMVLRRVSGPDDLRKGAFGIPEPTPGCPLHPPEEADLIVVPGIAFDTGGNRIGYGKGYYDRALHQLEGRGRLVGFCYDFQLVERIAGEPHDVLMDMIISERRVIRTRLSHPLFPDGH